MKGAELKADPRGQSHKRRKDERRKIAMLFPGPKLGCRVNVKEKKKKNQLTFPALGGGMGGAKVTRFPRLNQNKRGSVCKDGQQVRAIGSAGWGRGEVDSVG